MRRVPKRIRTCDEFEAALRRVPFAQARLPDLDWLVTTGDMTGRAYGLWHLLLRLVHDAIAQRDWWSVGELLKLYDSVQLAGRRGEMSEASYVAFLEDVRLPDDPAELRKFWQACPPVFLREIQEHRGIHRGC